MYTHTFEGKPPVSIYIKYVELEVLIKQQRMKTRIVLSIIIYITIVAAIYPFQSIFALKYVSIVTVIYCKCRNRKIPFQKFYFH